MNSNIPLIFFHTMFWRYGKITKNKEGLPVCQFLVNAASAACGAAAIAIPNPPAIKAPMIANVFFVISMVI